RFTLGDFLDDCETMSVEATYGFAADKDHVGFRVNSVGTNLGLPVLARPFFNAVTNKEDASLVAFPGLSQGTLDIRFHSYFDTGELNLAFAVAGEAERRIDLLGGFRCARVDEELAFSETDTISPTAPKFAGRTVNVKDLFRTENNFWGGQVGVRGLWQWKRFSFESTAKVAFGFVDREIDIR